MKQERKSRTKKERLVSHGVREYDRELILTSYFGFTPIETPEITKSDRNNIKVVKDPYQELERLRSEYPFGPDVLEKIAILRTYTDWKFANGPHPVFLSYHKPLGGSAHRRGSELTLGLEILGLSSSGAEAILIRTALSILEDEGFSNLTIRLNCLGDKESVADFERIINVYARRNINAMTTELRNAIKDDVFEVVRVCDPKCEKIQEAAPKSISFLTENSRMYFKEVLEYIESFNLPYVIEPTIIASPSFCSHTIFEIVNGDEKGEREVLATGFRYSRLSKKLGLKRELSAIGATISYKKKGSKTTVKNLPKPKFYLIQLGFQAKVKSLEVINVLRIAKVAIAHSLAKDKLQSQMGTAENMKVPYVLIIGQKEALENSVVVRDMSTRVQETVLIKDLAHYIKKLK